MKQEANADPSMFDRSDMTPVKIVMVLGTLIKEKVVKSIRPSTNPN